MAAAGLLGPDLVLGGRGEPNLPDVPVPAGVFKAEIRLKHSYRSIAFLTGRNSIYYNLADYLGGVVILSNSDLIWSAPTVTHNLTRRAISLHHLLSPGNSLALQ